MQMMREIEDVRNLASNVARLMEAGSYPALKKTKGVKVAFQDDYTKKEDSAFHFRPLVFLLFSSDFQFSSMNTNFQIPFLLPPYSLSIVIVLSLSFHERLIF